MSKAEVCFTCSGKILIGVQLPGASCSRGNYLGKNVLGERIQGAIALGGSFMPGNCPGGNYSRVIARGGGAKVLGVIVLGEFHREQFSREVVSQGGNIYGYMSGGQKSRGNCCKGFFLGGQLSGGSCPGGKRPDTVCSI